MGRRHSEPKWLYWRGPAAISRHVSRSITPGLSQSPTNKRLMGSELKFYGQIDFNIIHFLPKHEVSRCEVVNGKVYVNLRIYGSHNAWSVDGCKVCASLTVAVGGRQMSRYRLLPPQASASQLRIQKTILPSLLIRRSSRWFSSPGFWILSHQPWFISWVPGSHSGD